MVETFPVMMRQFRERAKSSRNALAHKVGVDPSYLTRIEHGNRTPPSHFIVDAIAESLNLTRLERDQLRLAGGYSPRVVNGSGWSPALHAVARVLNDYRLSAEERADFERIILAMASHWQPIKTEEG